MGICLKSNIGFYGRIVRAMAGVNLIIVGFVLAGFSPWIRIPVFACGVFCLLESLCGWCVLRACGFRTKI